MAKVRRNLISTGARLFAAEADSEAEKAKRFRRAIYTIRQWQNGRTSPPQNVRAQIEVWRPHIRAVLWDEFESTVSGGLPEPPPPLPPARLNAEPELTRELAGRLTAQVERLIRELEESSDLSDRMLLVKQYDQLAGALVRLGKFSGVELTERAVLDSPHFRRVLDTLLDALEPWPDALRAAAEAVGRMTSEPETDGE